MKKPRNNSLSGPANDSSSLTVVNSIPARLSKTFLHGGGGRDGNFLGVILCHAVLLTFSVSMFAQPVITNQPTWQTNVVGSIATFSVGATGAPPLSYQWRFNSVDRAGATEATLLVSNVQQANQGLYSVVVTESGGLSVTSIVARLYVIVPPGITTQPSCSWRASWPPSLGR